jgi:ABC-type sugar transport system ATPase subunit
MVFQNYALYPHMTVFDNLSFGLSAHRVPKPDVRRRVGEVAELLEIAHLLERRPGALSGGQRQRVALGRALVRDPRCFLMDEPLSNLDALLRDRMRIELRALHERLRIPTIYVTHDQAEAMTLADRIVVMRDGVVVQAGRAGDVYENPNTTFVAQFLGSPAMNILPVRLTEGPSGWTVESGGEGGAASAATLPDEVGDWLSSASGAGRTLSLGVRPEAVTAGGVPGLAVSAVCELVEHLGSRVHLHMRWGASRLVMVEDARSRVRIGDTVGLSIPWSDVYWFDADGRRLTPSAGRAIVAEGALL